MRRLKAIHRSYDLNSRCGSGLGSAKEMPWEQMNIIKILGIYRNIMRIWLGISWKYHKYVIPHSKKYTNDSKIGIPLVWEHHGNYIPNPYLPMIFLSLTSPFGYNVAPLHYQWQIWFGAFWWYILRIMFRTQEPMGIWWGWTTHHHGNHFHHPQWS